MAAKCTSLRLLINPRLTPTKVASSPCSYRSFLWLGARIAVPPLDRACYVVAAVVRQMSWVSQVGSEDGVACKVPCRNRDLVHCDVGHVGGGGGDVQEGKYQNIPEVQRNQDEMDL